MCYFYGITRGWSLVSVPSAWIEPHTSGNPHKFQVCGNGLALFKCPGPLPDFCHYQFCSRRLFTSTTWLLPTMCITYPPYCAQGRKPHDLRSQEGFLGSLSTSFFLSDRLGHGTRPFLPQDSADDLKRWMTLFRNPIGLVANVECFIF